MRLRDRRIFIKPEVMIIPMIDIMFFLLVFFMLSTLYMVNLKTIPVDMPKADHAEMQTSVTYLVTMKKDGSLWLEDKEIDEKTLLVQAKNENKKNPKFALVLRADQQLDYGKIVVFLDHLKAQGILHFGLAADSGR
ncbi:biopolymer transport protein ExbD [Propionispira arboris]|uniref:Biopolymer transport protein ExbD n=1 Tax=Propionispira arboris TaxID=84035 RepID=A0A1H7CJN8_9FIRM|nr:biopolymer transporter ExbD [Propionispira arboris]SEJ85905.1 biopolymer transport protein ExbD [Propionispira arboris]